MATRLIGFEPWAVNLPKLPQVTPVAEVGDVYPTSRAVSWSSTGDGTGTTTTTWLLQSSPDSIPQVVRQVSNSAFNQQYTLHTPNYIDATAVLTGPCPKNPGRGIARYDWEIATATLKNGGATLETQDLYEEREPILQLDNSVVEARKLAPMLAGGGSGGFANATHQNSPSMDLEIVTYFAQRSLGGDLLLFVADNGGFDADVYLVPINTATYEDDISTAVFLATVSEGFTTILAADVATAGAVRWEQFWIYLVSHFSTPGATWAVQSYTPYDLSPTYDVAGEGSYAFQKGGYIP